jgi:drug/metabolite transporter (DMT)-like permease
MELAMLCTSSLLGIVVGDLLWLRALVCIGARRVIIVDSIKPFIAAVLGMVFIGEELRLATLAGMFTTVFGVIIVSLEKSPGQEMVQTDTSNRTELELNAMHGSKEAVNASASALEESSSDGELQESNETAIVRGYLFAAVNVAFDAVGSLLTKVYGVTMSTWEINLVRFGFAASCLLLMLYTVYFTKLYFSRRTNGHIQFERVSSVDIQSSIGDMQNFTTSKTWGIVLETVLSPPNMTAWNWHAVGIGILFVTFSCPALANYALFKLDLGSCLTYTSLSPIFSLPLVYIMKGEVVSFRGCTGAMISVLGIIIMSFTL